MQEAFEILDSAKGKILTISQRQKLAVELAALMLNEANKIQTSAEKRRQAELARMMKDPRGKAFTTTDDRSMFPEQKLLTRRSPNDLSCLNSLAFPEYLDWTKRVFARSVSNSWENSAPDPGSAGNLDIATSNKNRDFPGEKHALSKHMRNEEKPRRPP